MCARVMLAPDRGVAKLRRRGMAAEPAQGGAPLPDDCRRPVCLGRLASRLARCPPPPTAPGLWRDHARAMDGRIRGCRAVGPLTRFRRLYPRSLTFPFPSIPQPPRLYPADDAPKPLARRSVTAPAKLRPSLQPGTVVILLAGRFKGKRAVLLKALPSGLLLVTGPFAVNGVPLRRVNAAYVIATSTSVDVSKVDVSKLDDAFFKATEPAKPKKGAKKEADFFSGGGDDAAKTKAEFKPEFVAAQKAVDAALTAALGDLKGYLATPFSLSKGDRPHLMKF